MLHQNKICSSNRVVKSISNYIKEVVCFSPNQHPVPCFWNVGMFNSLVRLAGPSSSLIWSHHCLSKGGSGCFKPQLSCTCLPWQCELGPQRHQEQNNQGGRTSALFVGALPLQNSQRKKKKTQEQFFPTSHHWWTHKSQNTECINS